MKRFERIIIKTVFTFLPVFLFALALTSCRRDSLDTEVEIQDEISVFNDEESDYIWDESEVTEITLSDDAISSASGTTVNGNTITINSTGTYRFSGNLSDGQIIVNVSSEELVRLLLNGIDINCSSNAPIYVVAAEKVIVNLADGSENYISDGSSYSTSDGPNACIYSTSDLTIFGNGTLNVTANYNDGITSKDGILINSGTINVGAEDDGIRGKDLLIISDANITIDCGGDGLLSDNEDGYIVVESGVFNINAEGDAIHSDYDITIYDGNFTINTDNDGIHADNEVVIESATININRSSEGIEGNYITVHSGTITVEATNDGFNATQGNEVGSNNGSQLTINDGNITVNMSGYDVDAMDSNGDITINLYIPSNSPASALDANGTITISSDASVYENDEEYSNSGSGPGGGH